MKKRLYLSLLILVSLAACQDEQSTTPSQSTATPAAVEKHASTVAVTKPAVQTQAQDLQASLAKNKAAATQAAKELTEPVASSASTESMKAKAADIAKAAEAAQVAQAAKTAEAVKAAQAAPKVQTTAVGDAIKGKSLARKCMSCHNFTAKKKVGPGLKDIFGRKAGVMPDMKYSKTLASGGWTWDENNLALWICDSKKSVKLLSGNAKGKTKMPAQRICDPGKQADIIAFLKTL